MHVKIYIRDKMEIRSTDFYSQIWFIVREEIRPPNKICCWIFHVYNKILFLFVSCSLVCETIKQNNSKQPSRILQKKCIEECIAELSVTDKTWDKIQSPNKCVYIYISHIFIKCIVIKLIFGFLPNPIQSSVLLIPKIILPFFISPY